MKHAPRPAPDIVYVTAQIDPKKTVAATHRECGCPIYSEDLPIREWMCEHGHYMSAHIIGENRQL